MKALNLKSILIAAIAATGLVAGSAMAGPTMDNFLKAYDSANSGKNTEIEFFADATGKTFNADDLVKFNGQATAVFNADSGLWVIDLADATPGYFLLKFGTGGTKVTQDTYVFENLDDLSQLVWSNEQVNFLTGGDCANGPNDDRCNIGKLSHVSYVPGEGGSGNPGGNPGEVPEPASLALLGAGLAGMALRRRRG